MHRGHGVMRPAMETTTRVAVLDCDVHKDFSPEIGAQYYGELVAAYLG
eukprot:SAG22_NODE_17583_length_302_cov_0.980296_1_plen_47_part_01